MTYIRIEGEIHSSKNSRRVLRTFGGRTIVAKSKSAKADEQTLYAQLLVQRTEWQSDQRSSIFPVRVKFYFYRQTKRRWDFLNIAQGIADAMVKAGYIPDDDVEHFIPVYAGHEVCKKQPGVDFWIENNK